MCARTPLVCVTSLSISVGLDPMRPIITKAPSSLVKLPMWSSRRPSITRYSRHDCLQVEARVLLVSPIYKHTNEIRGKTMSFLYMLQPWQILIWKVKQVVYDGKWILNYRFIFNPQEYHTLSTCDFSSNSTSLFSLITFFLLIEFY
jgi:hypothetical protein